MYPISRGKITSVSCILVCTNLVRCFFSGVFFLGGGVGVKEGGCLIRGNYSIQYSSHFFKHHLKARGPPGAGPRARALFAYRLTGPCL